LFDYLFAPKRESNCKFVYEKKIKNRGTPCYSFEIQPGPAGQSGTRPTWGWNQTGLKKNKKNHDLV
jgi:hypothetical protein